MSTDSVQGDRTLQMFFLQQGQPSGAPGGFSALALRAKASALYGAATHVSTNLGLRRTDPTSSSGAGNPAQDFQNLETTIARFVSTLLPIHQLGAGLPDEDRRSHVVTHTLAHAAYIQLHLRFAREGDVPSIEKCVRSARGAAQLIRHLVDSDYEYLDPTFGVSIIPLSSPARRANCFPLHSGVLVGRRQCVRPGEGPRCCVLAITAVRETPAATRAGLDCPCYDAAEFTVSDYGCVSVSIDSGFYMLVARLLRRFFVPVSELLVTKVFEGTSFS